MTRFFPDISLTVNNIPDISLTFPGFPDKWSPCKYRQSLGGEAQKDMKHYHPSHAELPGQQNVTYDHTL